MSENLNWEARNQNLKLKVLDIFNSPINAHFVEEVCAQTDVMDYSFNANTAGAHRVQSLMV